jgi:hypothetical protein
MKYPLAKIQDECRAKGWPTLTVLIVDAASGMPNEGCDAYWERQVSEAIKGVDWPGQAWW